MSFFNSNEEVIDVELTSYGKVLLSRGLLKPTYYSLHDSDVLYDVEYAGITENTNFAEVRIQDQTPVHKPFYSFASPKTFLNKDINQERFISQKANLSINKNNLSVHTLSNSTISNLYIPSWEIYNLSSNFSSSVNTFTDKNILNEAIPQFNVSINTIFIKTNQEQIDDDIKLQSLFSLENITFKDEEIYITVNNPLLLKIVENNVDVEDDDYEFELYKITKDENGNDSYTQMKFLKESSNYDSETDLYIQSSNNLNQEIDNTYADYMFDVLIDKEISNLNVCKYILKSTEDLDTIFNDSTVCDELRNKFSTNNLYDVPDSATGKVC